jgi:hypothetical protein
MKKALTGLFFFVALSSISFAQKVPFTSQEFVLKELVMKENTTSFNQRLIFNFKIFGKYNQDQIEPEAEKHSASYKLKFWLTDAKGDTLISPSTNASMLQSFSFFGIDSVRYKSYSFGHTIEIPYQAFKAYGSQTVHLWAQAQNTNGSIRLKPFKAGTFKINVPKLVPLEMQQIRIASPSILYDNKEYNGKGLTVIFSPQFLYSSAELYSEKETVDEVIFYVEFTTADGSPATMPNAPQTGQSTKLKSNYYVTEHKKNITKTAEIFVPYIHFFLPEGTQEIKYSIHATSKNLSKRWDNLAQGKFHLQMPPIYFAKAVVKNIRVAEKSYDVAAKDIPFAGLFVSSKNSKGKGYPDLFWTLENGYQKFISTPIVNNTFSAPDDSCSFQMIEGDVIQLGVYDYDTFSFNDEIGVFNFSMLNEQTTLKQTNLRSGDVLGGEILIQRRLRPHIPNMDLQVKPMSLNGTTGYQICGNISKDPTIQNKIYIKLADGTNQIPSWKVMNDIPSGANFSYFIPAWDLPDRAGFGLAAIDSYFHLPLIQKVASPEKYITETNDVKLDIKPLQQTIQNGVHGVILEINVLYPEGLVNKNTCKFKYQFKELSGIDLKHIIEDLKIVGAPICPSNVCNMQVFIPFYVLHEFSGKQINALFQGEVSINKEFLIGQNSAKLNAQVPTIVRLPKAQLSMNLKFAKNWSYVSISADYNGTKKTLVKENTQGGNMVTDIIFPTEYASEDDMVSIVITPYEFRTAMEPITWRFTAKDLINGTVILNKNKYAKKAALKTN